MKSHPQQQLVGGYFTRKSHLNTALSILNTVSKVLFLRWRKNEKPSTINSLLLVHFGGFGDALLLTSVLDALKEQMPECEIDIMVNDDVYHLLQHDTRFSNCYTMDNRFRKKYVLDIMKSRGDFKRIQKKYDAAVCLRSFIDNGVLPLYLSGIANYMVGFATGGFSFALDAVIPWVEGIHETEHYADALRQICPGISVKTPQVMYDRHAASVEMHAVIGEEPYLVVHFGSREKKRIIDAARSKEMLTWLIENTTANIVLTGSDNEAYLWERLNMKDDRITPVFGAFGIFTFMECIAQSAGVITVETFAAHVGAMVGVPVLSFWSGVTDYRQWQPLGKLVHVMRHPVPCAPCFKPCEGMECMRHDVVNGLTQAFNGSFHHCLPQKAVMKKQYRMSA
jgi:ADP-heptose:LPS heptosyltransferase